MRVSPSEVVAVIGLGYVGLPLASAFAHHRSVIGYDLNIQRVRSLRKGIDYAGESAKHELCQSRLRFSHRPSDLKRAQIYIIAVPTPVNEAKIPDLEPLRSASETVGEYLKKGDLVVFESTVYPGVTEEFCLPILEKKSGLKLGQFDLGYSPERINPGDHEHTLSKVIKVVSGHSVKATKRVAALYSLVAQAGVHRARNIMTAEAAKVIENIQRDLNIALMNELSMIFAKLGLRTKDVLDAAGTKWNFHKYHPGLVGGHCIGVDPYYLTHRALEIGIHPQVILAGRAVNDSMGQHVGEMIQRALVKAGKTPTGSKVLLMGLTFKEDVRDTRNSRVVDTIRYLRGFGVDVIACDPNLDRRVRLEDQVVTNFPFKEIKKIDAVAVINRHRPFQEISLDVLQSMMKPPVLIDLKNLYDPDQAVRRGFIYMSF